MKKYQVHCRLGNDVWMTTIEANYFTTNEAGNYHFWNTQTKKEWWFPIKNTVVTYEPE